ncbi:MAG: type I-C CRISPR-associated protein Cas8c/Csd1 [Candidatus Omnitrophica bacterium]|nr:type I-C CRISPR-associated protein Cas8c/Csd1 [Candidatus Omnitrophota bacterium]
MISNGLIEITGERPNKGKMFACPRTIRSKKGGGVSEFLTDTITSVFGFDSDPDKLSEQPAKKQKTRIDNNQEKFRDFWRQIEEGCERTKSSCLSAMLKWRQKTFPHDMQNESPPFLRWGTQIGKEGDKEKWIIHTSAGEKILGPGDRFTFQVDGQLVLLDNQLRNYWENDVSRKELENRDERVQRSFCILSGKQNLPLSISHPAIKNIPGAMANSYMVSFSSQKKGDVCSFASFGWKKGENVPISTRGADGYSLALNELLSNSDHNLRLGPSAICFWTRENNEFNSDLVNLFKKPSPLVIKQFFQRWSMGINDAILEQDRFYCISLSGNAGRTVVKRWFDASLRNASNNVSQWFDDLQIEEMPSKKEATPLSIYRLACTTVRDAKDLRSEIPILLVSAALENNPLPLIWLKPILHRFHCDLVNPDKGFALNPSRFALIKIILIRNRKGDAFMPTPALAETLDKPYNLGRLMAVLEHLQDASFEFQLEGAGVVDKYYGTASSAPATIFPLLLRLARHHLRKLERSGEKGKTRKFFIEKSMREIMALIQPDENAAPPSFPRILSLEEQGRFALGFYQQKVHEAQQRNQSKKENE